MHRRNSLAKILFSLLFPVFLGLTQPSAGGDEKPRPDDARQRRQLAERQFLQENPGSRFHRENGEIARIYGSSFSHGETARNAADRFRRDHSGLFGVEPAALESQERSAGKPEGQELMFQPESGDYKFTLFRYPQYRHGLPVFRAELRVLVRNEPGHPVVWSGSSLRDLSGYPPDSGSTAGLDRTDFLDARFQAARHAALEDSPGLLNFASPEVVVWTGVGGKPAEPRVALVFVGDNKGPGGSGDRSFLFVAGIETGEILHRENRLIDADVVGNVSGLATAGEAADLCDAEVATPMPWLRVTSGGSAAFSDSAGDYLVPDGGSTVEASLDGRWFDVFNRAGAEVAVSEPSTFDLLFNDTNDDEQIRAQVNGYVHANLVRDFTAAYNPAYPTFTDTDIPVWVNRTDSYCPGNAWYDPSDWSSPTGYSINFCSSSADRSNTAFSSVIYHEFGHHLVAAAGSGQGQYGEGMGDTMSLLINDSPLIGNGFYKTCGTPLRNAVNTLQYPCTGVHACAGVLSGSVWDSRMKMIASDPDGYIGILANLAVNAMLLHTGGEITPSITIDYLTLDDDDGDILNGTPHYDQLNSGFTNHNLAAPPISAGMVVSPPGEFYSAGPGGGPYVPESYVFTVRNVDQAGVVYGAYVSEPWLEVANGTGMLEPGESAEITLILNAAVNELGSGLHTDTVRFVNLTNHIGDQEREVRFEIDRLFYDGDDTPKPIPVGQLTTSTVAVPDDDCVGDVNVVVDLTHGSPESLKISLLPPAGDAIVLHAPGYLGDPNLSRTFDDEAGFPADGPGSLSDLKYGSAAGEWTLEVRNISFTDSGTLHHWALEIMLLGEECPPVAEHQAVNVPTLATSQIPLTAISITGGSLSFIVTELPAHGALSDAGGGAITSVPHTLSGGGNVVEYTPLNGYYGPDRFKYRADDGRQSVDAKVSVTVGTREVVHTESFDADPGWSAIGDWAFGQPWGEGSHRSDPESGYSGDNVYGYNLAGDYDDNMGEESLTSPPFDVSDRVAVQVSFRRWLGVEGSAFDHAEIQASNDGEEWTTIWTNPPGGVNDEGWSLQTLDISRVADRESSVRLRWVMGGTDGTMTYPGWNIDDLEISGVEAPPIIVLTVEPAQLSWSDLPGAAGYDLVRGDLSQLRTSSGDFAQSVAACVVNDHGGTALSYSDDPVPGGAYWYLVRGDSGAAVRTYDSFATSQVGLRDAEVEAAGANCP